MSFIELHLFTSTQFERGGGGEEGRETPTHIESNRLSLKADAGPHEGRAASIHMHS